MKTRIRKRKPYTETQAKEIYKDNAKNQAKAQLESIKEMVLELEAGQADEKNGNDSNGDRTEEAQRTIQEDALSVEVRSKWHTPGADITDGSCAPDEYKILLCTGGPACQIVGKLDDFGEPETAVIQYQDWGTPWTEYRLTSEEEETVLTYARCFDYGE